MRCILDSPPDPGTLETCDTVGVLSTIVSLITALEVTEGLKILTNQSDNCYGGIIEVDIWSGKWRHISFVKSTTNE